MTIHQYYRFTQQLPEAYQLLISGNLIEFFLSMLTQGNRDGKSGTSEVGGPW